MPPQGTNASHHEPRFLRVPPHITTTGNFRGRVSIIATAEIIIITTVHITSTIFTTGTYVASLKALSIYRALANQRAQSDFYMQQQETQRIYNLLVYYQFRISRP